jgi:hypothetical protein
MDQPTLSFLVPDPVELQPRRKLKVSKTIVKTTILHIELGFIIDFLSFK